MVFTGTENKTNNSIIKQIPQSKMPRTRIHRQWYGRSRSWRRIEAPVFEQLNIGICLKTNERIQRIQIYLMTDIEKDDNFNNLKRVLKLDPSVWQNLGKNNSYLTYCWIPDKLTVKCHRKAIWQINKAWYELRDIPVYSFFSMECCHQEIKNVVASIVLRRKQVFVLFKNLTH